MKKEIDYFFTKEEQQNIFNAMNITWNTIAPDVIESCHTGSEEFIETGENVVEVVFDAGSIVTYGELDIDLYNQIVKIFFTVVQPWAAKAWEHGGINF